MLVDKGKVNDPHNCNAQKLCNQVGLDAASQGRVLGPVTTVTLVVAGVGLTTGIVLVATSPTSTEPSAKVSLSLEVSPSQAGFGLIGIF